MMKPHHRSGPNGTVGSVYQVRDINPDAADSHPDSLTGVNDTLFFSANDSRGCELWKSGGAEVSTSLVKDINPDDNSCPYELTNVNGMLFFQADDGVNGGELWKSDGTGPGTTMVKDINPTYGSGPSDLLNVDGTLFFTADDGEKGTELWKSDGTEDGTVMVMDIYPGPEGSDLGYLVAGDGLLFFNADDGTTGIELWALAVRDLALTKTVEPAGPVAAGDTITYTLTYSNNGYVPVSGVVISDEVPFELDDVSVGSQWNLIPGETYAWHIGDLEPGEGGVITISGQIAYGGYAEYTLVNTATISTELREPDLSNNEATASIVVEESWLGQYSWVYLPMVVKSSP